MREDEGEGDNDPLLEVEVGVLTVVSTNVGENGVAGVLVDVIDVASVVGVDGVGVIVLDGDVSVVDGEKGVNCSSGCNFDGDFDRSGDSGVFV